MLISNFSFTQEKNIELEPKGVYSEIKIKNQNEMITKLLEPSTRADAVETIFKNINQYNPTVLYVFSQVLFVQGEQQNAIDWYLFAQINALYDANRCTDNSAKQATGILESRFKPVFEDYIKNNL